MKHILIVISLILSFQVFSKETILTNISNDFDLETGTIALELDENKDITKLIQTGYLKGKQIYRFVYSVDDLYERKSIYQRQGKNIVDLVSTNLNSYNGGIFNVSYLFNGIIGSRKSFDMELVRDSDDWFIEYEGKKIKDMKFIVNKKPIVGPIGVRFIKFNYL